MLFLEKIGKRIARIKGKLQRYQLFRCLNHIRADKKIPQCFRKRPDFDRSAYKKKYSESPLSGETDTFILYRILGNDLFPRHRRGQTLKNLEFILKNESAFQRCEKRFVVNRIVDPKQETDILQQLEEAQYAYLHIPFNLNEYHHTNWDIEGLAPELTPYSSHFSALSSTEQQLVKMRIYRFKNNYVMNNNGARNAALGQGKQLAKWVLPWDGNCFITEKAWNEIAAAVEASPEIPYVIVPMARMTDNLRLLDPDYRPESVDEPQIIFRNGIS